MCTEDRFTNLDLASTRPFPEDSSFTIIYEGPQNEFHVPLPRLLFLSSSAAAGEVASFQRTALVQVRQTRGEEDEEGADAMTG